MSTTSTTRRTALVAAKVESRVPSDRDGRARSPSAPPQGDDFNAEAQRRGELPNGWEVMRLRHCFSKIFSGLWGTDVSFENRGIVCFRVADFDYARGALSEERLTYRAYRAGEIAGRFVVKGDLLLEKSGGGDNSPVGRVVIVDKDFTATCSNFIQALHCKAGYNSKYLYYVFRSLYSRNVNCLYYTQTTGIQNLKVAEYLSLEVPLPPLPEQEAIVRYLDETTGKIDKAIATEERLIELLQERKQIIINEAVGGNISHAEAQRRRGWEVRRLRHCFAKIFSGLWGMDPAADNGGIVCYRVADFDYARGGISKNKLTYRAYRSGEIAGRMLENGDLLLEKSGGGDNTPVGRVVIVDKECEATCSNFIQALRCKDGYNSKFLCYVFCSLYSKKVNGYYYNQTTGIQNLKVAEYLSVEVPLPPLLEQEAIVKYLDEETGKIDRAIDVKRRQIALLRERREIIIDEVVTGKVKVA